MNKTKHEKQIKLAEILYENGIIWLLKINNR